jgi:hypothetical protein
MTATEAPASMRAMRAAPPTLVMTPQPIRQARSKGISFGTTMALVSCTTLHSAWDDTAEK